MKINGNLGKYYHYAFPMQAVLVTCNDKNGKTNVITIAWHTPISKKPPLYGISVAPSRYSYSLIEESKEFVINFAPYTLVDKVNFCGTRSGRKTDKIDETNLTLIPGEKLNTPVIKECFAHLECTLFDTIELGDHSFFVGEIKNILLDDDAFKNDILNNNDVKPVYYLGDCIYTTIDNKRKKC